MIEREAPLFGRPGPARPDALAELAPGIARIETERLLLRPFRASDFAEFAALVADPDAFRYSERGPMSGDEAWTRLLRHAGHWAVLGYGLFAIEEKATGRLIGETGLGDFRRALGPRFDGVAEACWTIARAAQGRGYATEAAAAAHHWAAARRGVERTVCLIHSGNAPSIAVARKLGYAPFAEIGYRGYRALLHERA